MLSDVLGASMQTITVNDTVTGSTDATVLGPFFVADAPRVELGGDIAFGAGGEPCWVEGTVTDTTGRPVPGATLEVWEADDDGLYDVQRPDAPAAARGRLEADGTGTFRFWALTPTPYPIPTDGPVGRLLAVANRSPMRAPHLHFLVEAPGYERLVTHVFRDGDRYLDSDAVFGVRSSLIAQWIHHEEGMAPDGTRLNTPFSTLEFDFVLNRSS
jgi:hydroxyquinol 1,2-dioxygenase